MIDLSRPDPVEYSAAGVPDTRGVCSPASVYRADELQQIFHNSGPLTLPDVQPGFSVPVNRLFA